MRNPALAIVVFNLLLMNVNAQNSNEPIDAKPAWITTPKQLLGPQNDTVPAGIRVARASRFSLPVPQPSPKGDLASGVPRTSVRRYYEHSKLPSYPTAESDVVVVAKVTSSQPFLSEDRNLVYSELAAQIESVLKNSQTPNDAAEYLTILQEGGTAEVGNGKAMQTPPPSGSMLLDSNKKYLLFLHAVPGTEAFSVLKAWDLSGQAPVELSYDGHYKSAKNSVDASGMSSESSLLEAVKSQLAKN